MNKRDEFLQVMLEKALVSNEQGPWLVVLPASGTVRRLYGALLFGNLGGEAKGQPYIVDPEIRTALAIDPRALIVHDKSLAVVWQPRKNLHRVHTAAREWYEQNPNVFCPETDSGMAPLL